MKLKATCHEEVGQILLASLCWASSPAAGKGQRRSLGMGVPLPVKNHGREGAESCRCVVGGEEGEIQHETVTEGDRGASQLDKGPFAVDISAALTKCRDKDSSAWLGWRRRRRRL